MLEAANADLVFTISLKRSTPNLLLSTNSPADYPIFWGKSRHDEIVVRLPLLIHFDHLLRDYSATQHVKWAIVELATCGSRPCSNSVCHLMCLRSSSRPETSSNDRSRRFGPRFVSLRDCTICTRTSESRACCHTSDEACACSQTFPHHTVGIQGARPHRKCVSVDAGVG
jgi:hypothetical protein